MTDLKSLLDQAAGHEPVVTGTQVAADLSRARLATRRRRIAGTGATAGVAAATIAALAVPLMVSDGSGSSVAGPPDAVVPGAPPMAQSAGDVLLAAAAKEENAQARTGKYFRVRSVRSIEWTVTGDGRLQRGPRGPGGYKLLELRVTERWTGLKGGTAWLGERSLGARPLTDADAAAWKKAGAPTSWKSGWRTVTTKPGKGSLSEWKAGADRYPTLGRQANLQDVLTLPTTPAGLRKKLLELKEPDFAASDVSAIVQIATELLGTTPVLPKTRAATFRLLAELEGARVTPNVTDVMGRKGTAVSFWFPANDHKVRLIIDPSGGSLLSSGHAGGKNVEVTVLLSGWTDEAPQIPPATLN